MSFYLIIFVIVFTVVYFSIVKDYKIIKFNSDTLVTLLISIFTISFYMQFSDNSLDLVLQKKSYEKFLNAKIEDRDLYREDVLKNPNIESQGLEILIDVLHEVELTNEDYNKLIQYCKEKNITFLSAAVTDFADSLGYCEYKIPLSEIFKSFSF